MLDGKPGPLFEDIDVLPLFSPNSQHVTYFAWQGEKGHVIFDGKPIMQFDECGLYSLTFSPDSKHFAYTAQKGKQSFVIVDGIQSPVYDDFPNYSHLIFDSSNSLHTLAVRNQSVFLVKLTIQ